MSTHDNKSRHFVISVLVSDRVGILRDISTAVHDLCANIDKISQTVVMGHFTVILTATFDTPCAAETIRTAVLRNFAKDEALIVVRPFRPESVRESPPSGDRYILTLNGKDRKGILKTVTTFLAEKKINIEDWYVHLDEDETTHIGEITVPPLLDIEQVQHELAQIASAMGLASSVQHENIFRATNEIGPINFLLRGSIR